MAKIQIDFFRNRIAMPFEKFFDSPHNFLIGSINLMISNGTMTEVIDPFIMFFDHENTVIITIISLSVFRKNIKTKFKVYRVRIGIVLFFGLRLSRFGSRICGWSIEQRISRLQFIRRTLLMRNQFAWSDSLHTGIE